MTLLLPLTADEWGDDEYAAVGALFGMPGDEVPRAGSGDPRDPMNFDILGVLARHPAMAREFLVYNAFLLQRGELPLRLRELAVLTAGPCAAVGVLLGRACQSRQGRRPHERGRRGSCARQRRTSTASTAWFLRPPTKCSPTVRRNLKRGNVSSTSSARTRRWNSSSSSVRTRCWRWRATPGPSCRHQAARNFPIRGPTDDDQRDGRVVLRPLACRPQRRPLSDVQAVPRRGTPLLQPRARLLCVEPVRRRQPHAGGSTVVQLCSWRRSGDHQVGHGDTTRPADLRGPAHSRHPPQPARARIHASEDQCAGTDDP